MSIFSPTGKLLVQLYIGYFHDSFLQLLWYCLLLETSEIFKMIDADDNCFIHINCKLCDMQKNTQWKYSTCICQIWQKCVQTNTNTLYPFLENNFNNYLRMFSPSFLAPMITKAHHLAPNVEVINIAHELWFEQLEIYSA